MVPVIVDIAKVLFFIVQLGTQLYNLIVQFIRLFYRF